MKDLIVALIGLPARAIHMAGDSRRAMKKSLLLLLAISTGCLMLEPLTAAADKPSIDHSVYGHWARVGMARVTDDGEFLMYSVRDNADGLDVLVIQRRNGGWKREYKGINDAYNARFTADSHFAVIMVKGNLELIELGTDRSEQIGSVKSYKMPKETSQWLAYQRAGDSGELVLRNLRNGKERALGRGLANFLFSDHGEVLVYESEAKTQTTVAQTLHWRNLNAGDDTAIWVGTNADAFVFDASGSKLAFLVETGVGADRRNVLWRYAKGAERAQKWVDSGSLGMPVGQTIAGGIEFSRDGSRIFFDLNAPPKEPPKPDAVSVDVWSYTDVRLQSFQLAELDTKSRQRPSPPRFAVSADDDRRVIPVASEHEWIIGIGSHFALIESVRGDLYEKSWNPSARPSVYLVSLLDGSRTLLADHFAWGSLWLSPSGKYVLYADPQRKGYFGYETRTGTWRNLTDKANVNWQMPSLGYPSDRYSMPRLETWLEDQDAALIADNYDIWKLDLTGRRPPINVSGGFGRKHRIVFRLCCSDAATALSERNLSQVSGGGYLLSAFNKDDKSSGFYRLKGLTGEEPQVLSMGPYAYDGYFEPDAGGSRPVSYALSKASKPPIYVVIRETAEISPNYYWTTDFKTFSRLSDVGPERNYNWMTSELVHWKLPDGTSSEGVLYKPEDFDPRKKYPLILYFYDKMSDTLHRYCTPDAIGSELGVPWLVSNDYLVFRPDIHYKLGAPGQGALDSVESAAEYLATMPWVDSRRMAIEAGSFGGYEVDYIVAHSKSFAAAYSRAGLTDLVSTYLEAGSAPGSNVASYGMDWAENGQGRLAATLWDAPEAYIRNSPIFAADQVVTPLLMMHNKLDGAVPFAQGTEFFTALRRLGKKVWMLQYDNEDHVVVNEKAALDLDTRIEQFFNHYLKGAPPPKWMTEGIPARRKGIDTGLELDTSGKEP
jgi:dipeptidyl aminopeptidase/acylaminoacyl peptidase